MKLAETGFQEWNDPEFNQTELKKTSLIKTNKIVTVNKFIFQKMLGTLSFDVMKKVNLALEKSLNL